MTFKSKNITLKIFTIDYKSWYQNQIWLKDGLIHREKYPAVIYSKGSMYWYKNDKLIKREIK